MGGEVLNDGNESGLVSKFIVNISFDNTTKEIPSLNVYVCVRCWWSQCVRMLVSVHFCFSKCCLE